MSQLWSTALALLLVCATAAAALRLLARRRPRGERRLRVVEELELGTRQTLYLVEAAGRCLLVGAGDGPLALLAELDPASARLRPGVSASEPGPSGAMPANPTGPAHSGLAPA